MKKLLFGIFAVCLLLLCTSCSGKTEVIPSSASVQWKDVTASAKVVTYQSLAEMEEKADLIVIGKKTEGDLYVQKSVSGHSYLAYSRFQLGTILKDKLGGAEKGQEILVLEMDVPDEEEGIRYHVDDYTAMNREDDYILFLTYNPNSYPKYYTIMGVNTGVCCLGDDYKMKSYGTDTHEDVDAWREEIRQKYLFGAH